MSKATEINLIKRLIGEIDGLERLTDKIDDLIDGLDAAFRHPWVYSTQHVERWEWLSSSDVTAKKREFYRKYIGRTGSVWKSEYAELNPDNWSLPLYEIGTNTLQPAPWNNAIHLINSKDGSSLDELYFSPKIFLKPPCVLHFDGYFPAFNTTNYPKGTYISVGFEINSGGYKGKIYESQIISDGSTVFVRLTSRFGIDRDWSTVDVSPNLAGSLSTGAWKSFTLVLLPNAFILYQDSTLIYELPITQDVYAYVSPYFANESATIVPNVKIGQFQAYSAEMFKVQRKVIDVSSISAGGYAESAVLVLPKEVAVKISVTYGSAATTGVRVYILGCTRDGSVIDSENTTDAFTYFEPTFAAGATRTTTKNIDMLPKYCRIRVRNKDSSVATGTVRVWVEEAW